LISLREKSLAGVIFVAGCGRTGSPTATGTPSPTPTVSSGPAPAVTPTPTAAPHVVFVPAPPHREDGVAGACLLLRGPIELPMRGAVALRLRGDSVDAVLNDNGRPRVVSVLVGPASRLAASGPEMASGVVTAALTVPCALAGDRTFCPDRSGVIHGTTVGGDDYPVASSRAGSRASAAALNGGHTALVYTASRMTSEGWVSEAWLAMDDAAPVRLSEDGSGATSAVLQARGPSLLAVMVDARAALTAMHVRAVGYDGKLQIGEDVVVFVGGPGDRRTAPALAVSTEGPGWALLPIAKDLGDFGLAVVRLEMPPRVDEPVVWSMYPNGLDPAPVAAVATVPSAHRAGGKDDGRVEKDAERRGQAETTVETRAWVARVRPRAAEPRAAHELELGALQDDGTFLARDIVATSAVISDVALVDDARGGLWLGWADASGSWLERLACR
jgi:hypothetical protein